MNKQSQTTALPKHTPTPWKLEACYGAVALVDERGIIVAHFREPNATANALKVAALLSQVARLREGLKMVLGAADWAARSGLSRQAKENIAGLCDWSKARALLAETEGVK